MENETGTSEMDKVIEEAEKNNNDLQDIRDRINVLSGKIGKIGGDDLTAHAPPEEEKVGAGPPINPRTSHMSRLDGCNRDRLDIIKDIVKTLSELEEVI